MSDAPLVDPYDRFPLGLPGHAVPVDSGSPTGIGRPWGMDRAVLPAPIRSMGKHGKPTSTKSTPKKTEYTDDSETRTDTVTQTVTD